MDYRYGLPWNQERGERKRLLAAAVVVVPLFLAFAGYVSWIELLSGTGRNRRRCRHSWQN